jgi:predicted ATPase
MVEDIRDKQISRIVIEGYKSIEKCDLELNTLNVLIGANGAGKSNLISFFKLIGKIVDEQLQLAVGESGGPDSVLHFGRKKQNGLKLSFILAIMGINLA